MTKKPLTILIYAICVSTFSACNSVNKHKEIENPIREESGTESVLETMEMHDENNVQYEEMQDTKEILQNEAPRGRSSSPPDFLTLDFDSTALLLEAFEQNKNYEVKGDYAPDGKDKVFAVLSAVADKIPSEGIMIPKYNGEEIAYSEYDQWGRPLESKVHLLTHDTVDGFADIFYYAPMATINTTPLSEDISRNTWSNGIKEFLNQRYPKLFLTESITNTETEMKFGDDIVPVIITDYRNYVNSDERLYVRFIIGGNTYVNIMVREDVLNSGALENISFEKVKIPKYMGEYMEQIRTSVWY